MPDPDVSDPHTLVFDGRGHIWFTAQQSNAVGRLTMATGEIELVAVPTPRARPYGIKIDSEARPWIVLFGTNKIATVDPSTLALEEITLARDETRPRRIAITSDDKIWYVDYAQGYLGRLDPETSQVEEWPTPGGRESRPYAMDVDDKDRLWFVESVRGQPSEFVGFDSESLEFFSSTQIESGGLTVRHMVFHAPTREIWFGTDANTIGRASIP
jgi:virginiamycin B lyase